AAEVRHIADQEGRDSEALTAWSACALRAERELAGAVRIARHSQVVSTPNIDAELEGVIAGTLQEIADKLKLLLLFIERAVAAVDAEAGAEVEAAVAFNKACEQ